MAAGYPAREFLEKRQKLDLVPTYSLVDIHVNDVGYLAVLGWKSQQGLYLFSILMIDFVRKIILFLLLQSFLILIGSIVWLSVPKSKYVEEDYLQSIVDNRERLRQMNGSRIVLIGGSSLGFSVSARDLSAGLGRQVMNTGVHAGLGYVNQWRIYEKLLDPVKDIIILSPEYKLIAQGRKYTNTVSYTHLTLPTIYSV